jgi:hypothetical protein
MTEMTSGRAARPASRSAGSIALAVGAYYLGVGLWAFLAPASFAGFAGFPPYNQHLFHDLGAFHAGIGVALVAAAAVRGALQPALIGALFASILHAMGGSAIQTLFLAALCALLAAAVALQYRASRSARSATVREVTR